MKYTELLKRIWDMDRTFSDKEIILYHYLLYRCNSLGWPDTFSLSNEELIQRLKCTRNTMRAARNSLIDAGLIRNLVDYGRGKTSSYSIVTDEEKGSISDPFFTEKGQFQTPFIDFEERKEKKEKKTFPPAPPIKEKKEKEKKEKHTLTRTHVREDGQFVLFGDKPLKKKRNIIEPYLPKDMDEVIRFFEMNAADKLPDWKTEAELFFYHFDSLGWVGTSNRKIQDWESRAYLWISDKALKNGKQERRQTEIDARNLRANGRAIELPQEGERTQGETQRRVYSVCRTDSAPKDYTKSF